MTDVRFEHSPGRGHPGFTADYTAFNVLIRCTTPQGRDAFVTIELKYSEAPAGIASPGRPRYDTLSRSAGVFRNPDAPALRHAPIEQFWREQLLVTTMLERGHYHDGRLIMIAPALVTERYLDFEPVHRALADTWRPRAPAEPPATPRADTVPTDPAVRTRRYSATSVSAARDSVGPRSRSWLLCVDD